MESRLAFVTVDDALVESLIAYTVNAGWHYCFGAFVQVWSEGAVSGPFRLKDPLAIEYHIKIRLGDPKWTRAELFCGCRHMVGNMWEEHWVDGVKDPDFPPIEDFDEDDEVVDPVDQLSKTDDAIFEALHSGLSSRFRWPSTLCQFCLGDADKVRLAMLPNGLRGYADRDFEMSLWRWAIVPTWARSSFLDRNYSRVGENHE